MKHSSDKAKNQETEEKNDQKEKKVTGNPVTEIHLPFVLRFCYQTAALASSVPLPRLISFITAYPGNHESFSSDLVFASSTHVFITPNSTSVSTMLYTESQPNWER